MSGVASTIPGTAPLARFAFLSVQQSHRSIRLIAFTLVVTCLASLHPIPATAQHRFNVPTSERGIQNAKQAAQIRLLETWAGLMKAAVTVTEDRKIGIGTNTPKLLLDVRGEGIFQGSLLLTPYGENPNAGIRTWGIDNSVRRGTTNDYMFRIFYKTHLETSSTGMTVLTARANGYVGIGVVVPTQKLHVAGNGLFGGTLTANAFYQQSDRNLKQHITPISSPFTLLSGIEGKRFQWKENSQSAYGIIAQDVEKVMPEAVVTSDNGVKSVDYSQMIAPLIEAVKQLENRVHELEAAEANPMLKGAGNGVFRILNIGVQ